MDFVGRPSEAREDAELEEIALVRVGLKISKSAEGRNDLHGNLLQSGMMLASSVANKVGASGTQLRSQMSVRFGFKAQGAVVGNPMLTPSAPGRLRGWSMFADKDDGVIQAVNPLAKAHGDGAVARMRAKDQMGGGKGVQKKHPGESTGHTDPIHASQGAALPKKLPRTLTSLLGGQGAADARRIFKEAPPGAMGRAIAENTGSAANSAALPVGRAVATDPPKGNESETRWEVPTASGESVVAEAVVQNGLHTSQ